MRLFRCALVGFILSAASSGTANPGRDKEKGDHPGAKDAHAVLAPDDIKWGPAPPDLPAGIKLAVLQGDPSKAAPYTIRAKLPDGCIVPPHWHSMDENLTVIKGELGMGMGEKFDKEKLRYLPAGSFARMPKMEKHFNIAKGETVIQLHGTGPFDIHYVNPADNPAKKDGKP
jgi:ChrR Cupin-like domain